MMWTAKQQAYLDGATHRWNIKCGATRSGKTYLDYYIIPKRIRAVAGLDGHVMLLGNTRGTLQRNVIEPMQKIWGAGLVGSIRSDNTAYLFGEKAYCLGADKISQVDRLRGSGVKYCYGDEVVSWHEEVFGMVKSRMDKPYSRFDGTCNPGSPSHWLKEFIDGDADVFYQQYSIYDNDFLASEVLREMEIEHTGVFHTRYIMGEWALAEGLIFPNFDKDLHTVESARLPETYEKLYVSNDYGTQHACVFQLWGLHGGVWYLAKELYHKGSDGLQKTVDEYYADLLAFTKGYRITQFIRDQAPIASSFNIHLRRKADFASRDCDNDVLGGIQDVATALNKGLIKISDTCVNTIREFGLYRWKQGVVKDEPVAEDDDALSALRYFVRTLKIAQPKAQRWI